jgi:hypothetical protein
MRNIAVYVVHNANVKHQVKSSCTKVYRQLLDGSTDDLPDWALGFTVDAAELNWKAARAIARKYIAAGGTL